MKRKYLYRLVMIMISLLFVPIMIISIVFWRNSLKELQVANDAYQEKILSAYVGVLDDMVIDFRDRAAFLCAKSKESTSHMFNGVDGLEEDYFRYYQIARELTELQPYMEASGGNWGVYLYDVDKIIRPGYTTEINDFIYDMEKNGYDGKYIRDFFDVENYKWTKDAFCTNRKEESGFGNLLMGFYTHIGTYQDKALVYFEISPEDMEEAMTFLDEERISFQLVNETTQETLLSWGDKLQVEDASVYEKETTIPGLYIVARASRDTLQQNMYEYATNTGKWMGILGVLLFVCCLGAVYITYKPIKQLTSDLNYENTEEDKRGDEITAIKQAIQRDRSKIEQQERAIKDLLLSNLLYGGHISKDRIKHLGIDDDMKYYAVYLLSGFVLSSDAAKELSTAVIEQFDSRLFVIALANQNRSAFVLFSKQEDVLEVRTYLREWLEEHDIASKNLYSGKVVDKMDDILLSFRAAKAREKKAIEAEHMPEEVVSTKVGKQKKLMDDILDYLELNYRDANLGQMQVADMFQMSNTTLSRMFKNHMGIGFAEYLIAKRLEFAKQLLLESHYSINEIATMSGFSSVHYFSRIFKNYQNMTPSAYRREIVQNTQE